MNLDHNIHSINSKHTKSCKLKEWYYSIIFKLSGGRGVTISQILPYRYTNWYYNHIKPIFKPQNNRIRKVIPRTWVDISNLIEIVNFEFVKSFYEDEYLLGSVNWEASPEHKKFSEWLKIAYQYITKERPDLEKQKEDAYPDYEYSLSNERNSKLSYKELYGEVDRLESIITKKDTKILNGIVKYRCYFWT